MTDVDSEDYMKAAQEPYPHSHPHKISRKQNPHLPHLIARDESTISKRTRRQNTQGQWVDDEAPQAGDYGPRITKEEFRILNEAGRKGHTGAHPRAKYTPIGGHHDGCTRDYRTSSPSHSGDRSSMASSVSLDTEKKWAPGTFKPPTSLTATANRIDAETH